MYLYFFADSLEEQMEKAIKKQKMKLSKELTIVPLQEMKKN